MSVLSLFPASGIERTQSGAVLSDCGNYRYQLWRIWDQSKPFCMFFMHNPSTADVTADDPTIRRCIGFAKSWGYGGIYVGNMFPYRSTDPKALKKVGIEVATGDFMLKWRHLTEMIGNCSMHVIATGNPVFGGMAQMEFANPLQWHYLKLTKAGNPCHPLYLPKELTPKKFI